MVRRLLLIAFFIGLASLVQGNQSPPKNDAGKFCYQAVVQVEGLNAQELFSHALAWSAKAYTSSKDVSQIVDKESGRLILKGYFEIPTGITYRMWHTLTIETKDGRYRYTLTDFWATCMDTKLLLEEANPDGKLIPETNKWALAIIEDLKKNMSKPKENW